MFEFFNRGSKKVTFNSKILRKNKISLLTLDERWNNLFVNTQKTPAIIKCEEKIRELLKEQARLGVELKEISSLKKMYVEKIMKLTTDVFDNNNEHSKREMQNCEKEIKRINERMVKIEEQLENIPDVIGQTNLELLENTVSHVYIKILENRKKAELLDQLIMETREKLKEYINEKESLAQDGTDTYSYFHDLLGAEELERLDKEFLNE